MFPTDWLNDVGGTATGGVATSEQAVLGAVRKQDEQTNHGSKQVVFLLGFHFSSLPDFPQKWIVISQIK